MYVRCHVCVCDYACFEHVADCVVISRYLICVYDTCPVDE